MEVSFPPLSNKEVKPLSAFWVWLAHATLNLKDRVNFSLLSKLICMCMCVNITRTRVKEFLHIYIYLYIFTEQKETAWLGSIPSFSKYRRTLICHL